VDICANWSGANISAAFQVFLCHNSQDKDEIRQLNKKLQSRGVKTWLDEEQLPPGRAWQELLEEQIPDIGSAAIFVGASGIGPWQNSEMRAFISEFVDRRCPVIPVILKSCRTVPQLPIFLRQFTWVDFRKPEPDPIERLIWGITGTKPA
jgi:TIR domain